MSAASNEAPLRNAKDAKRPGWQIETMYLDQYPIISLPFASSTSSLPSLSRLHPPESILPTCAHRSSELTLIGQVAFRHDSVALRGILDNSTVVALRCGEDAFAGSLRGGDLRGRELRIADREDTV